MCTSRVGPKDGLLPTEPYNPVYSPALRTSVIILVIRVHDLPSVELRDRISETG